jgi:FixJ family two-component response regulator
LFAFATPDKIATVTSERATRVVAIVDDDRSVLSSLKDLMESAGLSAWCYESAEAFLVSDQRHRTTCLVTDVRMPGMSGLELQAQLHGEGSRIPMIFITARDDAQIRMQAMTAGAVEVFSKPFDHEVLLKTVRAALKDGGV